MSSIIQYVAAVIVFPVAGYLSKRFRIRSGATSFWLWLLFLLVAEASVWILRNKLHDEYWIGMLVGAILYGGYVLVMGQRPWENTNEEIVGILKRIERGESHGKDLPK